MAGVLRLGRCPFLDTVAAPSTATSSAPLPGSARYDNAGAGAERDRVTRYGTLLPTCKEIMDTLASDIELFGVEGLTAYFACG